MQNPSGQSQQSAPSPHFEEILVVSRSLLFQDYPAWQGIMQNITPCMNAITNHCSFMPRPHAETNPAFKQIIPYLLFLVNGKLFVMQRKQSASEQRLASKFSIGIGGHIRQEDIANNDILDWANREFEEEVTYHGSKKLTVVGMLNDDSNDVGKVHLGLIILAHADSESIKINDEHKSGILLTRDECLALRSSMESWSQICLDFLIEQKLF